MTLIFPRNFLSLTYVHILCRPGKRGFYSPIVGKATPERLNAFRNVGRLMGLCLLQNELCPLYFNRHVLKFLLGRRVRFHDLAFFDPVIYESLRQLVIDAENKVRIFEEKDERRVFI